MRIRQALSCVLACFAVSLPIFATADTLPAPAVPDTGRFVYSPDEEYEELKADLEEALSYFFSQEQTIGQLVDSIEDTTASSAGSAGIDPATLTSIKAAAALVPRSFHDIPLPAISEIDAVFDTLVEDLIGEEERVDTSHKICLASTALAHTTATAVELMAVYPFEEPAAMFSFITSMATKCCGGIMVAPEHIELTPPNETVCTYDVADQRVNQDASWLFYFPNPFSPPKFDGWGDLGSPLLYHYNSDYSLRLSHATDFNGDRFFENPLDLGIGEPVCIREEFPAKIAGAVPDICVPTLVPPVFANPELLGANPFADDPVDFEDLALPIGRNKMHWKADTLFSVLDLIYFNIPEVPDENPAAKKITAKAILKFLKEIAQDQLTARFFQSFRSPETTVTGVQDVVVFDITDPVMTSEPSQFLNLEGLELGGASLRSYGDLLESAITATDSCDRPVTIVPPALEIWPVNQTIDVTWTGYDLGPNPQGERNSTTVTQAIRVIDTNPPILRRPDGVVAEYDTNSETPPIAIPVPQPEFFDLVDAMPTIESDVLEQPGVEMGPDGYLFPPGVTRVSWVATDQSGNMSAPVEQVINLKALGTNSQPAAISQTGNGARTAPWFTETTVALTGSDPDMDPLNFRISEFPDNGFLVAPLFPYFVEDYRVSHPTVDHCDEGRDPAEIVEPRYVEIVDDGRAFTLSASLEVDFDCTVDEPFHLISKNRVSIFDEDGGYIVGRDLPRTGDLFGLHVDVERGYLLYPYSGLNLASGAGATFAKLDSDTLETIAEFSTPLVSNARKAVIDGNGIMYATTGFPDDPDTGAFRIEVWDLRDVPDDPDGVLIDEARLLGKLPAYPPGRPDIDIEIGSDNSVYIATTQGITKYQPATINEDGTVALGALVGWAGACFGGNNCQTSEQRSFGYSCTPDTCDYAGILPEGDLGQFGSVGGIAIDPNDNLYVPDWEYERIQRFTPEGFFAGVAESNCESDERCFVLGDFGKPRVVSVNSQSFHVLDSDLDILHVFETSVITPVDDTTAEVTYKSNAAFHGDTDSFSFVTSDGLATSAAATVEVSVGKRPPVVTSTVNGAPHDEDEIITTTLGLVDLGPGETFDGSFALARQADKGEVTISGNVATYVPTANSFGDDFFEVTATDNETGLTSEPHRITVSPVEVNDAPTISTPVLQTPAGVSFPLVIRAEIFDVDDGESYLIEIDWGDGTLVDSNDAESGITFANAFATTDIVLARHTYEGSPGTRTIEICATDRLVPQGGDAPPVPGPDSITHCSNGVIEVVPMSGLQLRVEGGDTPVNEDETLAYRFDITNEVPEAMQAFAALVANGNTSVLDATGVELRVPLFLGLEYVSAVSTKGGCTTGNDPEGDAPAAILCTIGSVAVDEVVSVDVVVRYNGSAFVEGLYAETTADQAIRATPNAVVGAVQISCDAENIESCDDPLVCNGVETCPDSGICQGGTPLACAASDVCTVETCIEPQGCVAESAPVTICSDGDGCNGTETCAEGRCNSGQPLNCSGDDTCNIASCDAESGCLLTPITGGGCSSGCTLGGVCVEGECVGTPLCDPLCEHCAGGSSCSSLCGVPLSRAAQPTATDALFVLRSGVGLQICGLCACDVNNSGAVTASDALITLNKAIGQAVNVACPSVFSLEYSTTTSTMGVSSTTSTTLTLIEEY